MNSQVPVVVLGSGLTAVGVTRALGRAGIPIYAICAQGDILRSSRWYRPFPGLSAGADRPANLAVTLAKSPLSRAVLMPCADDWAVAVSRLPEELVDRFPSVLSQASTLDVLVDKWSFAGELVRLEIPHPDTKLLDTLETMRELPDRDYQGRFLKPCHSLEFARRHGVKAFQIENKRAALELMSRLVASDFPIVLQEYIPGPPTNHYFIDGYIDRTGSVRALFARRRLRMYPPLFGNSTLMETVPRACVSGAVDSIHRIAEALRLTGIFSAEFKYDDRDGKFKILEINARPWWYVEFAIRSGVDVCQAAYREALGLPPQQFPKYAIGRRCVHLSQDFKAFRLERPTAGDWVKWVRSWMGAQESFFCWDDPNPAWSYLRSLARHRFQDAPAKVGVLRAAPTSPASLSGSEPAHPALPGTLPK